MLNEKFLERMKEYLGSGYEAFLASYEKKNIRGISINKNVITNDLFEEIFDLDIKKIPYLENGYLLLNENVKIGFHPLHHAGAFYMQDPSAMCVVESIDFPSNYLALDLCAAPGGKSIQLAQKLNNGILISNEIERERSKILYSNIERMGLSNVIVTNNHPKDFLKAFEASFDLILVDAPCSGEGMFRKYPESIELWSLENVIQCQERDKMIVDTATKLLKKGGILIYSTCTFAKEENEDIISYLLNEYNYTQVDIKDDLKRNLTPGFIPKTYRFYPHVTEGEGQFIAVLQKLDGDIKTPKGYSKFVKSIEFNDFIKKNLTKEIKEVYLKNNDLYYYAAPFDLSSLRVLNYGVKLGEIYNRRFIPNHNIFKSFWHLFTNHLDLDFKDESVMKYLHGEQINAMVDNGFGVISVNGISLGGFKATNNALNNYYPKGLRNF